MPSIIDSSEGRAGSGRIRSQGGRAIFEETYTYLVEADHVTQTRLEILNTTPNLPRVNQTVGPSGYSVCRTVSADRRPNQVLYWDVTAEFSSEVEEGAGNNDPSSDPNVWVPVYETKFERYQEVVKEDYSGAAIANSAGQAFETGLTITRHIPIWEFYQFEPATVTDETVIARSETVNSGTFKGRAAKTLLCIVLSSVIGFYYGQRRRLTLYQLKYNERTWRHKRLDTGTEYLSGGSLIPFKDSEGNKYLGSLDGSGGAQPAGTDPAIVEFDMYATNSFSFLRI